MTALQREGERKHSRLFLRELGGEMARDRNGSAREEEVGARGDGEEQGEEPSGREHHKKAKRRKEESSGDSSGDSDSERGRGKKRKRKGSRSRGSRRRGTDSESEKESSYSDSYSESETDSEGDSESDSESESEGEEMLRRRKRKERRRKEREQEKERRRRKEKERERRRKREKEERRRRKERKKDKDMKKKKEKDKGTKGAVTNSWGKYGVIKETDMWNKRPEYTAWLAEIKQVNLETLSNWEEKQLFKQFMEDHNTATFPSKKYYNLDAYYRRKMENEVKRGVKKVFEMERTNFNDEEQRRQELLLEREKQKAEKVDELKRSMQSGMAQAMKEQARLREEMAYQYKLGNFEAAAAIQRRLDPDVPM